MAKPRKIPRGFPALYLALSHSYKQMQSLSLDDDSSAYLAETLADGSYFNGDQAQMKLQQALLTLPDKQRLVFNMKYFEDLKYDEISEIVGTSVGALKASYHLAVK